MPTRHLRASRRLLLGTLLLAAIVPVTARAADSPISTTSVVDGPVNAAVFDGSGRAYLGGQFNYVGPRLGSGIALTTASATPVAGLPDINGSVLAAVPDGAGGQFIGGAFTSVGGVARNRLAHLRADHSLDPDWNPNANGPVRALARSTSGDTIFIGGDFTNVGGTSRARLAAVPSGGTGAVTAWNPGANGSVHALAVSPTDVYVGGSFGSIGGITVPRLAKVGATGTGTPDPAWVPAPNGPFVDALALSGNDLFVGGLFFQIGTKSRSNLAKIATTGAGLADATWNPAPNNPVSALLLSGTDYLFVGGSFGGPIGTKVRSGLAKLSTSGAGDADATWDPNVFGVVDSLAMSGPDLVAGGLYQHIGGQDRNNLAKLSTSGTGAADAAWDPNVNNEVRALVTSGSDIFAGGDFSSAGPLNEFRGSLIRLNADGSLDKTWDPRVLGAVQTLALDGTDLFAGGFFNKVKSQTRPLIAKIPTTGTGAPDANWNPGATNVVRALAISGGSIFVGGDFAGPSSIGNPPVARDHLAKLSTSGTGMVDASWDPSVGGASVNALAI